MLLLLLVVVVWVVEREDNTVYLIQVSPPPELSTKPLLMSVNMATDKQELSHPRPVQ